MGHEGGQRRVMRERENGEEGGCDERMRGWDEMSGRKRAEGNDADEWRTEGCRDDRRRREQRGAQLKGLHTHHGRSNGSRCEQRGREGEDVVEAHGEVVDGWVVVLRWWWVVRMDVSQ